MSGFDLFENEKPRRRAPATEMPELPEVETTRRGMHRM
jgi:hypothetical protein